MDYYSILGVPKTASEKEIRSAYKKKSMQHHPDRGGNEEQFKQVNEAYQTLKDPIKKQQYDNPHPQGFGPNGFEGMHPNGFDDMMRQAGFNFGQGFANRRQTPRNKDITVAADVSLLDVLQGKNLFIQYRLSTGEIETVNVDIPPGANHGDTIQYEGLGDKGHPGYPRGNLHVRIRVQKDRTYIRDNDNLITKKTVNVFDLLLGCVIIITTLDKRSLELKIPQGTKPGTRFSIPGYGLPNMHTRKTGNMYVEIDTEMPKITDKNVLNKIQQVKNELRGL